jgi:hypothetical protein
MVTNFHPPSFAEVPRVVSVGGITAGELLLLLEDQGVRLNEFARCLFRDARFTTASCANGVEVIFSTVADLGLPDGGTYAQVLQRAQSQGLGVAPLELAAHLRLQWAHQPEFQTVGEFPKHHAPYGAVTVASAAPPDEQEIPWGFYLRRIEGELWLRGYSSWSGHIWSGIDQFAFVRAPNAA